MQQQQQQRAFGPPGSRNAPPSAAPRGPMMGNSNGPNWQQSQQQQAGRPNMGSPNNNNSSSGNNYNQGRAAGSWGHNKPPNANGSSQQGFSSPAAAAAGARSGTGRPPVVQKPQPSPLAPSVASPSTRPVSHQNGVAAAAASAGVRGGGKTTTTAKTVVLSCEPCEKDFTSEVARQAHLQSHVPCPEKGCGFSALRKVVNNHHEAKHGQFSGSGFQVQWRKCQVNGRLEVLCPLMCFLVCIVV